MKKLEKVLHMTGGAGASSYAANSTTQEKSIQSSRHMLEEAVTEVHKNLLPRNMVVADLGCASGPNAFVMLSEVMKIIRNQCEMLGLQPPEMQLFLNDLPGNDFNGIFELLDYFEERLQTETGTISVPYFVAGLPGSFYRRLFPTQTVHFFHSSFSIHWTSQVPEKLDNKRNDVPLNKGNIYIGKATSPLVVKLFQEQFERDFSFFLKLRFDELVSGGRMVLTLLGRINKDIYRGEISTGLELVSESLTSMVIEGLVEEEKMDSFNLPFYAPSMEEAMTVINAQELFDIIYIQMFEINWDPNNDDESDLDPVSANTRSAKKFAMSIRVALESVIASHFGAAIVDELFSRYAINIAKHLAKEKFMIPVLAISLKKRM